LRNLLGRYLCGYLGSSGSAFLSWRFDNCLLRDRSRRSIYDLESGLSRGLSWSLRGDRSFLGLGVFRLIVTTNPFVVGTAPHAVRLCIFN